MNFSLMAVLRKWLLYVVRKKLLNEYAYFYNKNCAKEDKICEDCETTDGREGQWKIDEQNPVKQIIYFLKK